MSNQVKVSDIVVDFIEKLKVKHVFLISGGGNIHLIDSIGRSKKIKFICNHHEQASATAAEAYSKVNGNIGVCVVTTGPGATNGITGIAGAWLDSIPVLCISGQVRRDLSAQGTGLRQLGDQEIFTVDIVKPITKYAITVTKELEVLYHLQKAVYLAKSGRPGPVWVDIPLDIQGTFVNWQNLKKFSEKEFILNIKSQREKTKLKKLVHKTIDKLQNSKRPVLYVGNGIRLAHATDELLKLINLIKIPTLVSYAGYDQVPNSNKYYFGRAHAFGQRAANFIIQNSDFLISIGARLDIRTIGFTYKAFARNAYKVIVDIDIAELNKKIISPNLKVNFDAANFIDEMISQLKSNEIKLKINDWRNYCKKMVAKYPNVPKEFWQEKNYVNPYCFIETISKHLKIGELIVLSDGVGPLNCSYQAFVVKNGQRIILNNGCAQMGYGLPASIGAAFANPGKRVICFEGDGSIQLNIHELQVIKHHNLPIKIFVYSNDGYLSIRNTQRNLFEGRFVGSNSKSGLSCPDIVRIAKAYGLEAIRISNHQDMEAKIVKALKAPGPIICDINSVRNLMLTPKLITKKTTEGKFVSPPLEEMSPLLPEKEFKENMLIPLWEEE